MEAKALESSGGEGKEGKEAVPVLREIIPKCGLLYSEKGNLTEVMCKPKIMPIKSVRMQKLEELIEKATAPPEEKEEEEEEKDAR